MPLEDAIEGLRGDVRLLASMLGQVLDRLVTPNTKRPEQTTTNSVPPSTPGKSEESVIISTPEVITYDLVSKSITQVSVQKGRDAALGVLAKFGVKTAKNLKEDQWADFVAACDGALAGEQ